MTKTEKTIEVERIPQKVNYWLYGISQGMYCRYPPGSSTCSHTCIFLIIHIHIAFFWYCWMNSSVFHAIINKTRKHGYFREKLQFRYSIIWQTVIYVGLSLLTELPIH